MANQHLAKSPPADASKAVGFYALYAAAFSFLLVRTLNLHPLFSGPSPSSRAWNAAWLWTTVADYYGVALALCGVVVASEPRRDAALWSAAILLLGCPFACMYVGTRLLRTGSLALAR